MEKSYKFTNFILKYLLLFISLIIIIFGILSIFITGYFETTYNATPEVTHFKYSFGIVEIVGAALLIIIIYLISNKLLNKVSSKYVLIAISIISFLAFILWINILKLEPIDDQRKIHEIALDMAFGNIQYHFTIPQYLFLYPYQLGIIYFVSLIYKIFGDNFLFFEYFNAICSITNIVLIYLISKELFNNKTLQKYLCILLAGFAIYFMFFNVFFYGNISGLTFALISLLFAIKYLNTHKYINIFITGISISISILLKTNYNIFLCGIVIVLIVDIINKFELKKVLSLIVLICGYLIISISYNLIMDLKYDITFPDGVPMINFIYMGMSDRELIYPRLV